MPLTKYRTTKMKRENIKSVAFKHVGECHEEYVRDRCLPMNGRGNWDENERAPHFSIPL